MRYFKERIRAYDEKRREKARIARYAIDILFTGGDFGDFLGLFSSFLLRLLERKKEKDERHIQMLMSNAKKPTDDEKDSHT